MLAQFDRWMNSGHHFSPVWLIDDVVIILGTVWLMDGGNFCHSLDTRRIAWLWWEAACCLSWSGLPRAGWATPTRIRETTFWKEGRTRGNTAAVCSSDWLILMELETLFVDLYSRSVWQSFKGILFVKLFSERVLQPSRLRPSEAFCAELYRYW